MRISIVGTGYVGLVTGVCLAHKGHRVTCVDVDRSKVDRINAGEPPFVEPGLPALLRRQVGRRFRATTDLAAAVAESDVTFIAVGTPFRGRRIDLRFVKRASAEVGRALRRKTTYHLVVVKSTVVPGTTDGVVRAALERASGARAGEAFGLGMNPEFLSEGEAVGDFMAPDRLVLGGIDARSVDVLAEVYRGFRGVPVIRTNTRTAEMIKYASNAVLASLISFSNEIGNLCAALGDVDAEEVMRGVHSSQYLSPRVGRGARVTAPIAAFLRAGCGFGGSCLPKDVKALVARGREAGRPMSLLRSVLAVNEAQPQQMLDLLQPHLAPLKGRRVAVLGLAFKPGTDDLRESPAIPLVRMLTAAGANVRAYDPVAMPAARRSGLFPGIGYGATLGSVMSWAEAALIVTAWPEFRALPALPAVRRGKVVVIDGRRILDPEACPRYAGIGRGAARTTPRSGEVHRAR
ncbi:MAG: UDP-glucose/GDP-mannose dehydrogenase family protein [Vicinamibacterales bacterium]